MDSRRGSSGASTAIESQHGLDAMVADADNRKAGSNVDLPTFEKPAVKVAINDLETGRTLASARAQSAAVPGLYGASLGPRAPMTGVVRPGFRTFQTDLQRRRANTGLWSLSTRPTGHADLVGWHPDPSESDEKPESVHEGPDPNLIVFEGPDDPINPQVRMRNLCIMICIHDP